MPAHKTDEQYSDTEIARRMDRALKRSLHTPPKAQAKRKVSRPKRSSAKADSDKR